MFCFWNPRSRRMVVTRTSCLYEGLILSYSYFVCVCVFPLIRLSFNDSWLGIHEGKGQFVCVCVLVCVCVCVCVDTASCSLSSGRAAFFLYSLSIEVNRCFIAVEAGSLYINVYMCGCMSHTAPMSMCGWKWMGGCTGDLLLISLCCLW